MLNTTELKANGRKLGSCRKVSKHANCLLKGYKGQNENLQHLETATQLNGNHCATRGWIEI